MWVETNVDQRSELGGPCKSRGCLRGYVVYKCHHSPTMKGGVSGGGAFEGIYILTSKRWNDDANVHTSKFTQTRGENEQWEFERASPQKAPRGLFIPLLFPLHRWMEGWGHTSSIKGYNWSWNCFRACSRCILGCSAQFDLVWQTILWW